MGIVNNISIFFNNRKYQKMKENYIKEYKNIGYLPSVDKLQNFIASKNIKLIDNKLNYGDKYDSIEKIFSDNTEILNKIKKNREEELLNNEKNSLYKMKTLYTDEPIIKSEEFKKMKDVIFNYDDYYNKKSKKIEINNESDVQKEIKDLERMDGILKEINSDEYNIKNFKKTTSDILKSFSFYSLNNTKDIKEQVEIITETEEFLDKFKIEEQNISFLELIKRVPDKSESVLKLVQKLDSVRGLSKYGIDISLEDNISYIEVNEKNKTDFYNNLDKEKEELVYKDFDVQDFALVRTTEYFPRQREMETIDELNSRTTQDNCFSVRIIDQEMKKKFGENYVGVMYQNEDNLDYEMREYRKSLVDKYETIATIYRSTKHFTLNGLVSSHEYGNFENKPYIIIDPLKEHIKDEGLLNLNESDTYFKSTREKTFKLSKNAELMMPVEEYLKIKNDSKMIEQISEYNLTLFSGDEKTAVDMKLKNMGYIPEDIGKWGYDLYGKFSKHIDKAVLDIAKEYGIESGIHFNSNVKKEDNEKEEKNNSKINEEFVDYVFEKLNIDERLKEKALKKNLSNEELELIFKNNGIENIKYKINEFNENKREELDKKYEEYNKTHYKNYKETKKTEILGEYV